MNWPPVILVAEDSDAEFVLLRCAFESAGLPHRLVSVAHGREALDYLYGEEGYSNREKFPFPDLMLVDLHMPVMNGFEVLAAVGRRFEFQNLAIVVLSSDDDPVAIRSAVRLGANEYILKPQLTVERVKVVRHLYERWLSGREKVAPEGRALGARLADEKVERKEL